MPYHTTKNVHRADHDIRQQQLDWEENDEDYRKEIFLLLQIPYHTKSDGWTDDVYYTLKYRDYNAFNNYWATEKYRKPLKRNTDWCWRCHNYGCVCSFRYCSCDFCYEVGTYTIYSAKPLLQKYFSAQEIYDTNERIIKEHCSLGKHCCQKHYVDCKYFPSSTSPLLKQEIYKYLLSGKEGIQPFTPQEIDMRFVTFCTVEYLFNILRDEVKECHNQKELNEKIALLAKYGMTLADHEEAKQKRQHID